MTAADVERLEAERLRPSPHDLGWRDDLDELIAVLAALLGHHKPRKPVPAGSYGYSPARGTARETR